MRKLIVTYQSVNVKRKMGRFYVRAIKYSDLLASMHFVPSLKKVENIKLDRATLKIEEINTVKIEEEMMEAEIKLPSKVYVNNMIFAC